MNIPYEGSLTKEEFKDLVKLGTRPIMKKSVAFIDLWLLILLIGVGLIVIGFRMLFITQNVYGGLVVFLVGVMLSSLSMSLRKAVDKAWDAYQKAGLKRAGNLTDHYLEVRSSAGNSQIFWTGLSGYGEYHNLLVLFQGQVGYPFAARFFQTEADWQEFKKFVASKLPLTHRVADSAFNPGNWLIWLLLILAVFALIYFNR